MPQTRYSGRMIDDSSTIAMQDVDNAIEELLFSGGTLNRKLLGAEVDE